MDGLASSRLDLHAELWKLRVTALGTCVEVHEHRIAPHIFARRLVIRICVHLVFLTWTVPRDLQLLKARARRPKQFLDFGDERLDGRIVQFQKYLRTCSDT